MSDQQKSSLSVKLDKSKMQNKGGVDVRETADGIEIVIADIQVEKVRDQKQQMIQAIGCYNNPGGPTC